MLPQALRHTLSLKKHFLKFYHFLFEQVIDFAKRYMYVIFSEGDLMEM